MRVLVLGPMNTDGEALSPRERAVLAALLVRSPTVMSGTELADAYWGDAPPATWPQQVKTSVARIRARLGADAIRTAPGGYALGLEPDSVDAVRFERLVSTARLHALHGEPERARDGYDRALSLWRGPAYQDVRTWPPGIAEAERLEEIRRSVEDELLEARLALGEARSVIADAERLVREDPLREGRWAVLALANYQAGRQADALACLRAARSRLGDELGIDPGRRLVELEGAILRQDPALEVRPVTPASSECPYRGLRAYHVEDADTFFGRETDIERVLQRVRRGSFLALVGASGCGKSSLAMAGVLPRLRERGSHVTAIRPAQLAGPGDRGTGTVLFIDQFEELFALSDDEIDARSAGLRMLIEDGASVLATVRSDFLDRCLAQPDLAPLFSAGVYPVLPMDSDDLRAAIEQPARLAGLRLEPGLTELLLRDAAHEPAALPMLSHALVQTWARREGSVLTVAGCQDSGGIGGAIAKSAEQLYQGLSATEQEACRALMLRLLDRSADGTTVRRRIHLRPLEDDSVRRDVIRRLVEARLVSAEGEWLVIAHESVATAWPRLDAWLDEDAAGARLIGALSVAAETWELDGEPEEDLYRGARLQTAMEWRNAAERDLTQTEERFLGASTARARTELDEREARVTREIRQNRRLRWAFGIAAGLLVVALITGGIAVVRGNEATTAAEDATIEAITSRSLSLRDTNRDMAALLAVEAFRRWPDDVRARSALMGAMTAAGSLTDVVYFPDAEWRIGAWPIPGTQTVAVVRDYTHLEVRDAHTGALVRPIAELEKQDFLFRPWVRVSADGSTILVLQHVREPEPDRDDADPAQDLDQRVSFFDVTGGTQIGESLLVDDVSETVSLSPDGSLATWAMTGSTVVVTRDTGSVKRTAVTRPTQNVLEPTSAVSVFLSDGMIVAGNVDGLMQVIDPATMQVTRSWIAPEGAAGWGQAATADGLIATFGPTALSVLDTSTGQPLWRRDLRDQECSRIAASAVQRLVLCGDEQGHITQWDLDTGARIGDAWQYQLGGTGDLALSDDETELLLMSAGAPAIGRFRIDGGGPASLSLGDRNAFVTTWIDPSGRYAVTADRRYRDVDTGDPLPRRVWDLESHDEVLRVPEDVTGADGKQIWDVRWAGPGILFAWVFDPRLRTLVDSDAEAESTGIIDVETGEFTELDLPTGADWVFTDPAGEVVYISFFDRGDTPAVEPSEIRSYDAETWRQLPWTIEVDGRVNSLTATPDRDRVLVSMWFDAVPAFRTVLLDARGRELAAGLPTVHSSLLLADGSSVAASTEKIQQFAPDTLDRSRTLPSNTGSPGGLSASTGDDTLLLTAGNGAASLSIVDLASGRQLGDSLDTDEGGGGSWIRPDGSGFLTSSPVGVQLWSLHPQEHRDAACRLAGREPDADEWTSYFADLGEQHPLCADVLN